MPKNVHFISGLPRSGSTLLAAILRQNPRIHASMSSPIGHIFRAIFNAMGADNEFSIFLKEEQKRAILAGLFANYYRSMDDPRDVVFDTNRLWTTRLPILLELFPDAKILCCVRNPAWILDSIECLIRKNTLDNSRLFNNTERATVYGRAEALQRRDRLIGFAWSALKEAYFGEHADKLLLVEYDLLASKPDQTIKLIYDFIGEEHYEHDFSNVEYEAEDFDAFMHTKGLHTVRKKVSFKPRKTILPPDLFQQYEALQFWNDGHPSRVNKIVKKPTMNTKP